MTKVLIISYFFPPCNLTAAQRTFGWAKYLNEFGYYPIIITRNWSIPIENPQDPFKKSGSEIIHEKNDNYEVFYLPYKPSLRDKLFVKYGNKKFQFLRKTLTFFELLFQNFTLKAVAYSNLYSFSRRYLKDNPDIKKLIITANPFILFRFGFFLKKEFNIKWIADYRDDWNTTELTSSKSTLSKILQPIESGNEQKWVGTASFITSVSKYYTEKISKFVNVKGYEIINGFEKEDIQAEIHEQPYSCFTIVYNGTLYDSQPIEFFLNGYKKFIDHNKQPVQLLFPGIAYDLNQLKRIEKSMKGYENYYKAYGRQPRTEVLKLQSKSHLFLMISHDKLKGIPSSKLYEYLSFEKPILVCPPDDDIIENTLKETGLGFFARNENEVFNNLNTLFQKFQNNEKLIVGSINTEKFTRKNSALLMSQVLDKL